MVPPVKIDLYDTTLRDGMQGIDVSFTLTDKIQIAKALDEIGFDYIEGGFPFSNEKEAAFFEAIKKENLTHAKVTAFGSTRAPGGSASSDPGLNALLKTGMPAITIVGKSWKAHVKKVIHTNVEENLAMIVESIEYCKKHTDQVILDLEHFFDGYRDDPNFSLELLREATKAGADCLVLCDTNGGTLPGQVTAIIGGLPIKELAPIGVHFHDDCGTAVANSMISLDLGAVHIQGTINGWGERCGNANLCSIAPNIAFKTAYKINIAKNLPDLTSLSRFVAEKANIIPNKRAPYVGQAAFSHKAGQHADVISKAPELMEHLSGSLVGNERRILLSELAGKSTIVKKISRYGNYTKNSPEVAAIIEELKRKENLGYEYEAAEASFFLLVRKELGLYKQLSELNNYHLESFKTGGLPSKTTGRIFLEAMGKHLMGAGVGTGPIETLDMALRDALTPFHPFIKKISLVDYRVRVLNPEQASAAKVRVFITSSDHEHTWDTVGVSENIVEASWEALTDSFEYFYNRYVTDN
ncbi:MAG: citramalate synthase [Spirochaetales bacterium]|nr:citramalate synthase [Spirochaetales bacterium]